MNRTTPFTIEEFLDLSAPRVRDLRAFRSPWASAWVLDNLDLMVVEWWRLGGPDRRSESLRLLMNAIWGEGTFARAMASIDEPKGEPVIVAPSAIPFLPALTVLPDDVLAAVA